MEKIRELLVKLSTDLPLVDLSLVDVQLTKLLESLAIKSLSREVILDEVSQLCAGKIFVHPDWSLLAGRVMVTSIQEQVPKTFGGVTYQLEKLLHPEYYAFVMEHRDELDAMIVRDRDMRYNLFAAKTFAKTYLAHVQRLSESGNGNSKSVIAETPQDLFLRVATYLWYPNMEKIKSVYDDLSLGNYAHASPTLANAGMNKPQLGSCFLVEVGDSLDEIERSWKRTAEISRNMGGLGMAYGNLRHSNIAGGGDSGGIVKWAKIQAQILEAVDQGGRRKGSGTLYLPMHHKDIKVFIELRDEGPEELRAKSIFLGVMVPDLFMKRVIEGGVWSLFCPNEARELFNTYGDEFEKRYIELENQGKYAEQVSAEGLYNKLVAMQIKKGGPFVLFIDAINRKSNQSNIGMVKCSNLCCEIVEVTSKDEVASCNLGSISLGQCVVDVMRDGKFQGRRTFDFVKLAKLAGKLVQNINQVIDRNYYIPRVPQIKKSNLRHRPLGIGVQGLADAIAMLDLSWIVKSPKGKYELNPAVEKLNRLIFETIYYAALKKSMKLAKKFGPYETFDGSPLSKGLFQFDLWDAEIDPRTKLPRGLKPNHPGMGSDFVDDGAYDSEMWDALRTKIMRHGVRNSLLIALMPTASTAHILGNNECFEPFMELISSRTVLSGQYALVNKHLAKDLQEIGLWNSETIQNIISNQGSIQNLVVPDLDSTTQRRVEYLKLKYLTVFEMPQRPLVKLAADRGRCVDQTQSMNCFMKDPTMAMVKSYLRYGWEEGLKTGMYYLRSPALSAPIDFTKDQEQKKAIVPTPTVTPSLVTISTPSVTPNVVCTDEVCTMCSS